MFKFLPAILILAFLPTWIIAGPAHTHQADLVVAADGSGDYTTLQAAIDAVPNNGTEEFILLIKKGIYTEKILIPASKTHLTLLGEDVDSTIIIWDDYSGKVVNGTTIGTSTSYTFRVDADYFKAQYLTFENNAGEVGQAVAVLVNGDKNIFYHCRLVGDQDTYYTKGYGRIYMKDCYIEGTTDFIFGRAVVVFDSCYVYSKKNSYITAASTEKEYAFGYVFFDCQLAGKPNTQVYLGRPWRPYAQTVFIRTFLDKHVYPAGWSEWNGNNNHDTCFYAEYNCFGPRALRTYRKSWSHELTEEQAADYTLANIFAQSTAPSVYSDDWIPQIDSLPYTPFVNIDWVNSIAELKETFQMRVFPNPTDSRVEFSFTLEKPKQVSLHLYDVEGRLVFTEHSKTRHAGPQSMLADLSDLPVGSYTYQLHVSDQMITGTLAKQ